MSDFHQPTRVLKRFLIVGLGNPGRSYEGNRHNIGFMAVDRLAERHGITLARGRKKAITGQGVICQRRVILAKPQTLMNLSGDSVGPLVRFFEIPLESVLVIYDDIDLPFGAIRLREKGGSGGHNGMKSIIRYIGPEFPRLRLGVGRPPGNMDPADYVLKDFQWTDRPVLEQMLNQAVGAVESFLTEGLDMAMNLFNVSSEQ